MGKELADYFASALFIGFVCVVASSIGIGIAVTLLAIRWFL